VRLAVYGGSEGGGEDRGMGRIEAEGLEDGRRKTRRSFNFMISDLRNEEAEQT